MSVLPPEVLDPPALATIRRVVLETLRARPLLRGDMDNVIPDEELNPCPFGTAVGSKPEEGCVHAPRFDVLANYVSTGGLTGRMESSRQVGRLGSDFVRPMGSCESRP